MGGHPGDLGDYQAQNAAENAQNLDDYAKTTADRFWQDYSNDLKNGTNPDKAIDHLVKHIEQRRLYLLDQDKRNDSHLGSEQFSYILEHLQKISEGKEQGYTRSDNQVYITAADEPKSDQPDFPTAYHFCKPAEHSFAAGNKWDIVATIPNNYNFEHQPGQQPDYRPGTAAEADAEMYKKAGSGDK